MQRRWKSWDAGLDREKEAVKEYIIKIKCLIPEDHEKDEFNRYELHVDDEHNLGMIAGATMMMLHNLITRSTYGMEKGVEIFVKQYFESALYQKTWREKNGDKK